MAFKNKEKEKAYKKAYYQANKEQIKAYREANKEKIAKQNKAYREANKEKISEQKKAYYQANKEQAKVYREANKDYKKAYYESNKKQFLEQAKVYREANKEKIKERNKAYREANKEKIAEQRKLYERQRRAKDPLFRLRVSYSQSCRRAFQSISQEKNKKSLKLLDLNDWRELAEHLSKQFYNHPETGEKMTFDNHGLYGWHIDHIIPLDSAKTEEEIIKLCHYTNLQPMWAEENRAKSNKILDAQ